MIVHNVQAIILAAGKSTRFKTGKSKLVEKICGQELIVYSTRLFAELAIPTTVVVGYQKEAVVDTVTRHHADSISFVTQHEQQGTGHAIACTQDQWIAEHILIMNGDMPLVTRDIIESLYTTHINTNAIISFVTAHNTEPNTGYGRIVQDENTIRIVEAKEFTGDSAQHCCINAGIYIVKKTFLITAIAQCTQNETSKEFYFTDIIKMASDAELVVQTVSAPFDRIRGINTLNELWAAEHIKRSELIKHWMDNGVRFSLAHTTHVDLDVTIGAGSTIGSGVHLLRGTHIGIQCTVEPFSIIEHSTIGDNSVVYAHSVIKDSIIGTDTQVGPFAHIKQESAIGNNTIIGNFVEVKKSTVGNKTKAKHLSYLGDAHIGNGVNIGAGTITCNHNGKTKNSTIIRDNAYVGANTVLIAPVTVEHTAMTAAGSVITHDVPAYALALARARQINKEGYRYPDEETDQKKNSLSAADTKIDSDLSFVGAVRLVNDHTLDT